MWLVHKYAHGYLACTWEIYIYWRLSEISFELFRDIYWLILNTSISDQSRRALPAPLRLQRLPAWFWRTQPPLQSGDCGFRRWGFFVWPRSVHRHLPKWTCCKMFWSIMVVWRSTLVSAVGKASWTDHLWCALYSHVIDICAMSASYLGDKKEILCGEKEAPPCSEIGANWKIDATWPGEK